MLYSFSHVNGVTPYAGLIDVGGTLYGTTTGGGSGSDCSSGCGTLFSVSTTGAQRVLYDFGSYKHDGLYPAASVIDVDGTFYGTTRSGGFGSECALGCGTVFSLSTGGKERVLYSFGSFKHDGITPVASLINVKGTLYGTTQMGGSHGSGTIFSVTTTGKERVLYDFGSYPGDGLNPAASLLYLDGTLYGTTEHGGQNETGTVFIVSTTGKQQVIYSFGTLPDGKNPRAPLIVSNGTLYGTTAGGGAYEDGTVFSMSTIGTEQVLHNFGKGPDGKDPEAALLSARGALYGTTSQGGADSYGTIFSVTKTGKEKVVYSFDGTQGGYPYAGLTEADSSLFGTTSYGGSGSGCSTARLSGCGTIFELHQ